MSLHNFCHVAQKVSPSSAKFIACLVWMELACVTTRKETLLQGALSQEFNGGDLMSPDKKSQVIAAWHNGITYARIFV